MVALMRFKCPKCSKLLQMSDELRGKRVKCPQCQTLLQTPAKASPAATPTLPRASSKPGVVKATPITSTGSRPAAARAAIAKPVPAKPISSKPVADKQVSARPISAAPISSAPISSESGVFDADADSFAPVDAASDPLGSLDLDAAAPYAPASYATLNTQRPRGSGKKSNKLPILLIGGGVGLVALVLLGVVAVVFLLPSGGGATVARGTGDLQLRVPSDSAVALGLPTFPTLGNPQRLGEVDLYTVQLSSTTDIGRPGYETKMRIYVPRSATAPKSIPCVLVAPAGTMGLHGSDLDAGDYHDETLPYAKAGMAVIHYSLDGPLGDVNSFVSEAQLIRALAAAYRKFSDAEAGVVNGRIALELALARLPQVDPQRIYCAGHSSAGTVSLRLAASEPRIAKCVAYAPVTHLAVRLGPMLNESSVLRAMPDLPQFVKDHSPYNNASKINCPVFLFQARDDSNEPWQNTNAFANLMTKNLSKDCTFVSVDRGDHYEPMISTGIPQAIQWLQR